MDDGYAVYYRKEELRDYTTEEIVEELERRMKTSGTKGIFRTRLDKARELFPDLTEDDIVQDRCPDDCIPELYSMVCPETSACKSCWNMKYVER